MKISFNSQAVSRGQAVLPVEMFFLSQSNTNLSKNVYVQKKNVKSDPFEKGQGWRRDSERSLVGKNILNNLTGKEK